MAFSQKQVVGQMSYKQGVVGGIEELKEANLYREVGRGNNRTTVLNFSIATQQRKRGDDNELKDSDPIWTQCEAWGRLADNIAESFKRGDRVILIGDEKVDPAYKREDGTEVPPRNKLRVNEAGLSVFFDTAESHREVSTGNRSGGSSNRRSNSSKSSSSSKSRSKSEVKESDVEEFDIDKLDLDFADDGEAPF